jgi:hypothetical protein
MRLTLPMVSEQSRRGKGKARGWGVELEGIPMADVEGALWSAGALAQ